MKKIFPLFVSLIVLCSCGGGGGSSTSEPTKSSQTPSIKLQKSILYLQGTENGVSTSYKEEISFEIENLKGNIYIGAKNNNPELIERVYLPVINNINSSTSTLTLYVAQPILTGLKRGTHQGTVNLILCEDSQCVKQISNSLTTISIVYDVL